MRKVRKLLRTPGLFLRDLRILRRLARNHPAFAALGGPIRFGAHREMAPGLWRALVLGAPEPEWPGLDVAYPEFEKLFVARQARLGDVTAEIATGRYHLLLTWECSAGRLLQRINGSATASLPVLNVMRGPLPTLPGDADLRSYALDWKSPHINSRRSGNLHLLLDHLDFDLVEPAVEVAEALLARCAPGRRAAWPPRCILAVLQDPRDPEFVLGSPDRLLPRAFLSRVEKQYPGARILALPTSPFGSAAALAAAVPAARGMAELLPCGSRLETLARDADLVATVSSGLGLEALVRGRRLVTFGAPWYGGRGLTEECSASPPSRARQLSRAQLIAAAALLYPRWIDATTRRLIDLDGLLARLQPDLEETKAIAA